MVSQLCQNAIDTTRILLLAQGLNFLFSFTDMLRYVQQALIYSSIRLPSNETIGHRNYTKRRSVLVRVFCSCFCFYYRLI